MTHVHNFLALHYKGHHYLRGMYHSNLSSSIRLSLSCFCSSVHCSRMLSSTCSCSLLNLLCLFYFFSSPGCFSGSISR
ncbi:unnamed protein product [Moneuplotes crassus]|uniref:Uncharacterized protein n=1 Tax=Euplotes crassus TaxID=5936 RepID=A0AAD1XX34_EUPCR|nr:unnamed protein product [Moneuplotes crassus]